MIDAVPVERGGSFVRAYPRSMGAFDAVLVDAGGVLVLPDRDAVSAALGPGSWNSAPEVLDRAHYRAVAAVDDARPDSDRAIIPTYIAAYLESLEVSAGRRDLVDALAAHLRRRNAVLEHRYL